ncbi:MAG: S9 family peptidase [Thermoanaerobaculia bacterium]|nr:S9 family peptidase [Thermoanaerobaculia bacterium]
MLRRLLLASPLLLLPHAALAADKKPFTAQDLWSMERISEPAVSPDGKTVAFTLRRTDFAADRGRTDLWRVGVDGTGLTRLTTHDAGDSTPVFAPDGQSLFFYSTRSGSGQVWRLPLAGGEPVQVTQLPFDVGSWSLSPDGTRLAVSMEVYPDCATLACSEERSAAAEKRKATGRLYDQLMVRHWDTWKDGKRSQLFVVPVAGGDAVDVTRGIAGDVPSKPFGGAEEFAWTPDGKGLIVTAKVVGREEAWSTDYDLYHVVADGTGTPKNLTDANPAWDTQPQFSPDGKHLVYLAMARPGFEADRFRIMVLDWPGGTTARALTETWDRSVDSMTFAPDGKTLLVTAQDVGQVALFTVDFATGKPWRIFADGHVRNPAYAGNRIVFGRDTMKSPVDLYSIDLQGQNLKALTAVNAERLAGIAFGDFEQFSFPGAKGDKVHGYVVKPANFDPTKKYPIAFLIHGGPQGSFGNDFHYRWNPQAYAGAGYAAVMIDFHGSTGYGQAFTDSISGDWGGAPLEDLKKGMAFALQQYPFLDGEKACALGASYGGFMINWIAGQWRDGFRCLVNHDGLFDQRMMYYTTEELWFPEWEQGGPYFRNPEAHEKFNPARFVDRWQTPMLVVHGALDYRVPETQGLATFTALQRRGIPSRLLQFPNENHWVLKPSNGLLWHETVLEWLARWTK